MASGMATTILNIAVMAAGYPIYLHFLGYEQYGVWLVLAVVLTFAQLGDIGISSAITKLVAEEYGTINIGGIQCYIMTALAILCLSGTIVLATVLVFRLQIVALFKLNPENAKLAIWLLPYIGILSIYIFIVNIFNATLSGLGRMDLANYIQTASKAIAVAIATVLLYSGKGIKSMIISSFISYLFVQIFSIIYIRKIIPVRILHISNLNAQHGKRLLSFGGTVFSGAILSMFLSPFNKLILSRYVGISSVPIYEIAYNGSMQIRNLFEVALRALMPEVSRIGIDKTIQAKNRVSHLYRRSMKLIFSLSIPVYMILLVFTPALLSIWLRNRFVELLPYAFRIMLVGTFLSLLCIPAYHILMGLGKNKYCFMSHAILCIANVIAVVGLITLQVKPTVELVSMTSMAAMGLATIYVITKYLGTMNSFEQELF